MLFDVFYDLYQFFILVDYFIPEYFSEKTNAG